MPTKDKEVKLLTTVNSDFEAEELEAYLHNCKIPVLKKYREAGDYLKVYMGNSVYGIDIYVPENLFEQAKDAISAFDKGDTEIQEDDEMKTAARKRKTLQRILAWMVVILFVPGALWVLIGFIIGLIVHFS